MFALFHLFLDWSGMKRAAAAEKKKKVKRNVAIALNCCANSVNRRAHQLNRYKIERKSHCKYQLTHMPGINKNV